MLNKTAYHVAVLKTSKVLTFRIPFPNCNVGSSISTAFTAIVGKDMTKKSEPFLELFRIKQEDSTDFLMSWSRQNNVKMLCKIILCTF